MHREEKTWRRFCSQARCLWAQNVFPKLSVQSTPVQTHTLQEVTDGELGHMVQQQ